MDTNTPSSEITAEMSFTDKIVNVISAPGELYTYVAQEGKNAANYGLPLLMSIIMGMLFIFVVFSVPAVQNQLTEQQEKGFQKQVAAGKMSAEQFEKIREQMPKPGGPMTMIFGSVMIVVTMAVLLYGSAFLYWLGGKYAFKAIVPYGKVVEVVGLSFYIMVLGSLVTMLIAYSMESMYMGTNLGILFGASYDPSNVLHALLTKIDIFTLWSLFVISIGLSKVFALPHVKALIIVGAVWVGYVVISVGMTAIFN